jgi:hypothetical protein
MANQASPMRMSPGVMGVGAQEIPPEKYQAKVPFTPGKHLWWVCVGYEVDPGGFLSGDFSMTTANMLGVDGPSCYWCARRYSPREMTRACRGVPVDEVKVPPVRSRKRRVRKWTRSVDAPPE